MTCTDCTCFVIDYGISITYVLPTGWMYHASYSIQYCISAAIPSIIIARQVFATRKRRHHHPRWSGEGKGRGGGRSAFRSSILSPFHLSNLSRRPVLLSACFASFGENSETFQCRSILQCSRPGNSGHAAASVTLSPCGGKKCNILHCSL